MMDKNKGSMDMNMKIPVLLLKTKSTPSDAYEELFSQATGSFHFEPYFVPVLQHRFQDEGTEQVSQLLRDGKISNAEDCSYGGMIFTSQRAVEAFAYMVSKAERGWPHVQKIPIYSVGPATTRALGAIQQEPRLQIYGEHTGNGEALAQFMLHHYREWYSDRAELPPLLFLVGDQRRDIIPKTLMDQKLPGGRRIPVTEIVVYGTGVMESFSSDFNVLLRELESRRLTWVVVFSPTGCDDMLAGLNLLDGSGKARHGYQNDTDKRIFVATIGPTTRDFLKEKFGVNPDVCSGKPSPEGVWTAITQHMSERIEK